LRITQDASIYQIRPGFYGQEKNTVRTFAPSEADWVSILAEGIWNGRVNSHNGQQTSARADSEVPTWTPGDFSRSERMAWEDVPKNEDVVPKLANNFI
jgi:hypothetical protein